MSSKSDNATGMAKAEPGAFALPDGQRRVNGRRPPASKAEAQLRAHVDELQGQLVAVARCLEAAENRAAQTLVLQARVTSLEAQLAIIKATRSWRVTRPIRAGRQRVRRLLGR